MRTRRMQAGLLKTTTPGTDLPGYEPQDGTTETTDQKDPVIPDEQDSNPQSPPPSLKRASKRRRVKPSTWDASNILIDAESPIAKVNIRNLLASPVAWDMLDIESQTQIIAMFPDRRHIVTDDSGTERPNFASLMNDDSFHNSCMLYTEDIAQGRHEPDWLASAWAASERRKRGDFDAYLEKKFEADWKVHIAEDPGINPSETVSELVDVSSPTHGVSNKNMPFVHNVGDAKQTEDETFSTSQDMSGNTEHMDIS